MKAKVKNTAIITFIAAVLVLTLTFAVLYAPDRAASGEGGISASAASAIVDGNSLKEDGEVEHRLTEVPEGYTAIGGDSGNDFSYVRNNPTANYILMGDITVGSLDTGTVFSGILNGNGYTITINANEINTTGSELSAGGLFHTLTGTVENVMINVEKFQLGIGSAGDNHFAGMVAAIINGGTVENAYITLRQSPVTTTASGAGTNCDFYMYAYSALGSGFLILGGVAGNTRGNAVIKNVTVDNRSTGSYGFGVAGWQTNGSWLGGNTTLNHVVGGIIGRVGFGETNMATTLTNITLKGADDAKFILFNEASSGYRNKYGYGGGICGWIDSSTTLNVNGLIYDFPGEFNTNLITTNMSSANFGRLIGLTEGRYSMTAVFYKSFNSSEGNSIYNNPSSLTWLSGVSAEETAGGVVIYPDTIQISFDKSNEGNVIISGAYSSVMGEEDLIFGVRFGNEIIPLYDSLIVNSQEEKQTGLYVSGRKGSAQFGVGYTNTAFEWVHAYYGAARYNSASSVTSDGDRTSAQYTYNFSQARVYLDTYRGESVVTQALDYAYAFDGNAVNAGIYELTLDENYIYTAPDGTRYLVDEKGGGFVTTDDLAEKVYVTVNPAKVTGTVSGALNITYGESLSSVINGLSLDLQNTYADFAGAAGLDVTAVLRGGNGETYNTYSGAGSVFDISVASISPNYDMSAVVCDATLTVMKRPVTGSVTAPLNAVYDGQAHAAGFFAYSGSAANNEDISEMLVYTYVSGDNTSTEAPVNAGGYTVTVSFAEGSNYEFAASEDNVITTASFEIAKADVKWNVQSNQFGYMGEEFAVRWGIAGVNEEDSSALKQAVLEGWAEGSAPVSEGEYRYNLTFSGDNNYNESSFTVTYNVQKVQVSISMQAEGAIEVEYGSEINIENLGGGVFTVNGVKVTVTADVSFGSGVEIGEMNVSLTATADSTSAAGEYMLVATAENGENYDVISSAALAFDVVPKKASVPAAEGAVLSKVYDGQAADDLESLFNDVSGQGLVITIKDAQGNTVESIVNAGVYTVSATFASGNYSGEGSVTFTVEKANSAPVIESAERTGSGAVITVQGGNAGVEYSLDGVTWTALPANGVISLQLAERVDISFRYAQTENITGEKTCAVQVLLTYDALEENIQALPDDLDFADMDIWNSISGLAGMALAGEKSETFDSSVNAYKAQAQQLKEGAQSAVQGAFGTAGALISGSGVPEQTEEDGGSLLWLVITLAAVAAAELAVAAVLTAKTVKDRKKDKKTLGAALFLMGAAAYEIALIAVFAVLAAGLAVYIGIISARIATKKKSKGDGGNEQA